MQFLPCAWALELTSVEAKTVLNACILFSCFESQSYFSDTPSQGMGRMSQITGRAMKGAFVTSHVHSKEENVWAAQVPFPGSGVGL